MGKDLIISKFLKRKVFNLFLFLSLIFFLILLFNHFVLVLDESLELRFSLEDIFFLIGLKTLRDFSLIISLSYILATFLTLQQMSKKSEYLILETGGLSILNKLTFFSKLIALVFLVLAVQLNFLNPLLSERIENIRGNALSDAYLVNLKSKNFETIADDTTFYFEGESYVENEKIFKNVFLSLNKNSSTIILADSAKFIKGKNEFFLSINNGIAYQGLDKGEKNIISFTEYKVSLDEENSSSSNLNFSESTLDTFYLIEQLNNKNFAEVQFRLLFPLNLIFFSFFSIVLVKNNPKQNSKFVLPILVLIYGFFVNYVLSLKLNIGEGYLNYFYSILPYLLLISLSFLVYFIQRLYR